MQIKKFPKVAVVATKLNFLQYTYRFRINHKTLYSQTFPGPHFGSWTNSFIAYRVGYGISFANIDLRPVSVSVGLRARKCHIGSHYNGIRLYQLVVEYSMIS